MRTRVTTHRLSPPQYLESPAGSGSPFEAGKGSSSCLKGGKQVGCKWDDVSQAEAYAHTLAAFHKAFPDFASHDLYLTGESYFGQYAHAASKCSTWRADQCSPRHTDRFRPVHRRT